MAHMAPYRLPGPALEPPPSAKKRRKTASGAAAISAPQPPPTMQDLLPPAPTGYGDTVVASNPFDDTPTVQNSSNMMTHHMMRGMGPPSGMNQMQMGMPSPMGPMRSPNMGPMSPIHGMAPMGSPMSVHCGRPLSGGGGPMGSPINPMVPPMGSPMNMGPQIHSPGLNGPINNPTMNNSPIGMNSNMMNSPMGMNTGQIGVPNSPMGMTTTQLNMNNNNSLNMNNTGPMGINNPICMNNSISPMSMNSGSMNGSMAMSNGPMNINNNTMGMPNNPIGPRMNGPMSNNAMMAPTSLNSNINSSQAGIPSNMGPMQNNSGPLNNTPHSSLGMSPMSNNSNQIGPPGPSPQARTGPSPINSGNQIGSNQNQIPGSISNQMPLRQSPLNVGSQVVSSVSNSLGPGSAPTSVSNQTATSVAISQGHVSSASNSINVSSIGSVSACNVSLSGPNMVTAGGINSHSNQIGPTTSTTTINTVNNMPSGQVMHPSGPNNGPSQNSIPCGPANINHASNSMGPPMNFINSNQMGQGGMGSCQPSMGPIGSNGSVGPGVMSHMNSSPVQVNHMGPMGIYGSSIGAKSLSVTAGKVYPADQPMVFNPQNPNAPPIYPCGVCHKEVHDNDQAILCESGCNFWFHRSCTGLTEGAYQLLTAEVYAEWVCDKCLASKHIPLVKFKP